MCNLPNLLWLQDLAKITDGCSNHFPLMFYCYEADLFFKNCHKFISSENLASWSCFPPLFLTRVECLKLERTLLTERGAHTDLTWHESRGGWGRTGQVATVSHTHTHTHVHTWHCCHTHTHTLKHTHTHTYGDKRGEVIGLPLHLWRSVVNMSLLVLRKILFLK